MGKYFEWLYPQVDLCLKCPEDGTCLKNVQNYSPPLKLKECKLFPPTLLGEIKKYGGLQLLPAWDTKKAARVAAASGSDGRPILYISTNVIEPIIGAIKIFKKALRHPLVVAIISVLLTLTLGPLVSLHVAQWFSIKQIPPASEVNQTLPGSPSSGASGDYSGNKTHSHSPEGTSQKPDGKSPVHPASK